MVPPELRYTKDHEWVRLDGDIATVGVTTFAAEQLGDVVFVELPESGRVLEQHGTFGVVESVKAVSDLFAPVAGEVLEGNAGPRRPAGARQQRPVRGGLDDPDPDQRAERARRPARRRRVRAADVQFMICPSGRVRPAPTESPASGQTGHRSRCRPGASRQVSEAGQTASRDLTSRGRLPIVPAA